MTDILLPKDEYRKRLLVCEACEHIAPLQRCRLCGCFVVGKAKISASTCPANKWPEDQRSLGSPR